MTSIIICGYLINLAVCVMSGIGHPAPSTIKYALPEKIMYAVPYGVCVAMGIELISDLIG